ncbi:MAG: hypothetical protein KAQ83_01135 [Nanoarchaeota archaeon]|nr:hypothetical protein [Nanoarchaeota archaeon]
MYLQRRAKQKKGKSKVLISFLVCAIFLFLFSLSVFAFSSATLKTYNGTELNYIEYDRYGQEVENDSSSNIYGSNSYMDYSGTTPNLFLDICQDNLSVGDRVGLSYMSENGSIMFNVVNYLPNVFSTTNHSANGTDYECSNIDIDISSKYAIFPGYIYPFIVHSDITYSRYETGVNEIDILDKVQLFNGSYDLAVNIEGPPKTYLISIDKIYDHNNTEIENYPLEDYLIFSLLNSTNSTVVSDLLRPNQDLEYEGNFNGGEKVYINGLQSLDILAYEPCTELNDSGYYIMTNSTFNNNETCVTINNSNNIVINFVDEVIDGDGLANGSKKPTICAVTIENSENIVLENFKAQEYYYGLCIKNSSVNIFGTASAANIHGAIIDGNSSVSLVDVFFGNNNSEIYAIEDSRVNLTHVNFTTAEVKSEIRNMRIRSVINPPDLPNITDIMDIDQFIEFVNTTGDSEATMAFYYQEPLPNNMSLGNISIYQRHGERNTHNVTNTTSYFNTTLNQTVNITTSYEVYGWEDGNWTELDTLIAPASSIILHGNEFSGIITITNFSIFAPLGFPNSTDKQDEPEPEPDPTPDPDPEAGGGGAGGGSQKDVQRADNEVIPAAPEPILLELEMITKEITLMQGEVGDVYFNISNVGDVIATNVVIGPDPSNGWDYSNYSIGTLSSEDTAIGNFQIAPYFKAVPRDYFVQVKGYVLHGDNYVKVVSETIKVKVLPRGNLARLRIIEYPPEIIVNPFSKETISLLAENIGDQDLEGITIKLEDSPCILDIEGSESLDWKETKSIKYKFSFGDEEVCNYNVKFYDSQDRLVGFLPLKFVVKTKTWRDEPVKTSIVIFIIIAWTALTTFVIARKRSIYENGKKKEKSKGNL